MFRTHEASIAWKAGFLATLVHVLLLGALLFSFNWKAVHTIAGVSEVELWDTLPMAKPTPKKRIAKPKPKVPKVEKPEPVLAPEPEEVKPEPETRKVDIELENKKKKEEEEAEKKKKAEDKKKKEEAEAEKKKKAEEAEKKKKAEDKKKKEEARKKQLEVLQKQVLDDVDLDQVALEKLQAEIRGDNKKPAQVSDQGVVNEYVAKIIAKVHGNVNRALCAGGNPVVIFKVSLLPTGEFVSSPTLSKSSGNAACDNAVERAMIASEPFPLPSDPATLSEFRNLGLTFKPNAE